jgi:hypothetical protein
VAVYLDFDNIVMSWYDRVHGRNAYHRDRARIQQDITEPEIAARLEAATVDVGAILDFAASFGTLVLTRAYADWSSPVNAMYRRQLVGRAVDLVQLFPAAAYAKNAGDSDFVPLTQRVKRLGRYVIGIGVAGSTAKSLAAACDMFEPYDTLPGVPELPKRPAQDRRRSEKPASEKDSPEKDPAKEPEKDSAETASDTDSADKEPGEKRSGRSRRSRRAASAPETAEQPDDEDVIPAFEDTPPEDLHNVATNLLERALRVGQDKGDDQGFLYASAVKQHIRRMDPSFSEKALGYRSFNDFLASRDGLAELHESGHERLVRLKQ